MVPQMRPAPPPVDDSLDTSQIEVVVGLRQGAPELGFELGQILRRQLGQHSVDGWPAAFQTNGLRHAAHHRAGRSQACGRGCRGGGVTAPRARNLHAA